MEQQCCRGSLSAGDQARSTAGLQSVTMTAQLPPPFELDETYIDRDGLYTVIAIEGDTLVIKRPSGERSLAPAALKARIHRNIVADRDRPARRATTRARHRGPSESGFTLGEVLPIVAQTIEALSHSTEGFARHRDIVAVLVANPTLRPLIERLAAEDPGAKPGEWWASNFLQFFSKEITLGTSPWRLPKRSTAPTETTVPAHDSSAGNQSASAPLLPALAK
jgi:hypothetical protein